MLKLIFHNFWENTNIVKTHWIISEKWSILTENHFIQFMLNLLLQVYSLSVCLYACLSVCLSICPTVSLFLYFLFVVKKKHLFLSLKNMSFVKITSFWEKFSFIFEGNFCSNFEKWFLNQISSEFWVNFKLIFLIYDFINKMQMKVKFIFH